MYSTGRPTPLITPYAMLASSLLFTTYPTITPYLQVSEALVVAEDAGYTQMAVVDENRFLGFVSLKQLEDADAAERVTELSLLKTQVQAQAHLLQVLHSSVVHDSAFVAVVEQDGQYLGSLGPAELNTAMNTLLNAGDAGGIIVLEMDRRQYSFGELSRLVETNESYITQLNTYTEAGTGMFIVTIRINRAELSDVVATLQRYDYNIRYYFGEENYQNELRENYSALMNYLNL